MRVEVGEAGKRSRWLERAWGFLLKYGPVGGGEDGGSRSLLFEHRNLISMTFNDLI